MPLFGDAPEGRFCYLPKEVLDDALQDPKVLDGLMLYLGAPGKSVAALKRLTPAEKLKAINHQVAHLRNTQTSEWYGVDTSEVLAAAIFSAPHIRDGVVSDYFAGVSRESELLTPVASWLRERGYEAYPEVPLGTKRIDVLGCRKKGFFSAERIIGVELKNELSQLGRALDQMTTFREYSHVVYIACTPFFAAEYLVKHVSARGVHHWDPLALKRKLQTFGFGMLLVEDDEVTEVLAPVERTPDERKAVELRHCLSTMKAKGAGA
jgi:hypothetical protein